MKISNYPSSKAPASSFLRITIILLMILMPACHSGGSTASGLPAAAITAQPTDQTVVSGTSATFTVAASNATGYQWQISTNSGGSFSNISSATAASYSTGVTALSDSGTQYRVVVAGSANTVTSSAVTLTVTAAPVAPSISVHPADLTVTAGQDAGFSVTAAGTSLSYQWQRSTNSGASFSDIGAATGATLNLTAVPLGNDGHQFHVVVSNVTGSITSNPATLTVNAPTAAPVFTTQSVSVSIIAGDSTQFTVAVTGTPTPTLQWQLSTDGGGSWGNIVGQTGTSYNVVGAGVLNNGRQFRVVATNSVDTVTSNAATLTVTAAVAPAFSTQPSGVSIAEGQNAQFTVAVTGTPTPTLQWQLSINGGSTWTNINGATGTVLNVTGVALADDGRQYRAVATNSVSAVPSDAATLTVTAAVTLTITTTSPLPAGTTTVAYSITLAASGGTPPYTWSAADGYTLPAFLTLDPSTGVLSGTPPTESMYAVRIKVLDSADPQQTVEKTFDLNIEAICDVGFGSLTVAGAPITVGGKFCPQTSNPPGTPNGFNLVTPSWVETYPYGGGSYYESVGVSFDPGTGQVSELSFHLNDQTRMLTYICGPTATVDYPACTGVTVNTGTGLIEFINTEVGSGSSPRYTLNGQLKY